jgi:hypothetical protein
MEQVILAENASKWNRSRLLKAAQKISPASNTLTVGGAGMETY